MLYWLFFGSSALIASIRCRRHQADPGHHDVPAAGADSNIIIMFQISWIILGLLHRLIGNPV